MRTLTFFCLLLMLASFQRPEPIPQKENWTPLFDGKTLTGWHSYGKTTTGKSWVVEDGAIHLQSNSDKNGYQTHDGGDLVTNGEFTDFELKLEWKISANGNSGIIFYVAEDPKYKETWHTGIETQVLDINGNEDRKNPKHNVSDIYDLIAGTSHPAKPFGEWNKVRLYSKQGHLEVFLNDVQVVSTTLWDDHWKELIAGSKFKNMPGFGTFRTGRIALQDHGNEVWYRNISIRKL